MAISFSPLQREAWKNSIHGGYRWNFSIGATRSGKTYLDYFKIPYRVRHAGDGLIVLLGNTSSTLERNILEPMRNMYGDELVGYVTNKDNSLRLFGRKAYAIGADNARQVKRIQGAGMAYCYGDEVTTWSWDVFEMLKSRIDKPYSVFDGTCNPDSPRHPLKKFIDNEKLDIYIQSFTIDDNPYLPKDFVKNLKLEYEGTVHYNRFILGQWALAEGLVHPQFANKIDEYAISYEEACDKKKHLLEQIYIGLDIGGTKSHSAMVATGFTRGFREQIRLNYKKIIHSKGTVDPDKIYNAFEEFVKETRDMYDGVPIMAVFVDNAEQVIKNGLSHYVMRNGIGINVMDCKKTEFKNRVIAYNAVFNTRRFYYVKGTCDEIAESLATMIYDEKERLVDDFSTDVDTYDADYYSWSHFIDYFHL